MNGKRTQEQFRKKTLGAFTSPSFTSKTSFPQGLSVIDEILPLSEGGKGETIALIVFASAFSHISFIDCPFSVVIVELLSIGCIAKVRSFSGEK